jgi:hypothetical protein
MKTARLRSALILSSLSLLPLVTGCVRDDEGNLRLTPTEGIFSIIGVIIIGYVKNLPLGEKIFGGISGFFRPKGESINEKAIRERVARDRKTGEMPAAELAFVRAVAAAAGYVEGAEEMTPDLEYVIRRQMKKLSGGDESLEGELLNVFRTCGGSWYSMCYFENEPDRISVFFSILAEIITGDSMVSDEEKSRFTDVAEHFGYSLEEAMAMLQDSERFRRFWDSGSGGGSAGMSYDDALRTLGVSSLTSDREVKKAYMRLAQRYHPDKVRNRGFSEDVIKLYQRKFGIITDAWNTVREKRGI